MQAAGAFAKGLQQIEGLQLAGSPAMTVVAFRASKPRALNIYALNDLMSQRGWHLSALQLPPALHMCFTGQHASIVDSLLKVMLLLSCLAHGQSSADCIDSLLKVMVLIICLAHGQSSADCIVTETRNQSRPAHVLWWGQHASLIKALRKVFCQAVSPIVARIAVSRGHDRLFLASARV